ncbi:MAG: bifunctional 23S rRNA (guanine(2069)-N(7))-methyltransferase RlmK/23S rRNA (guanine(2445)-N(2))-methyltransferase RlmL [Wenzhouxiangellaceae bacterium]
MTSFHTFIASTPPGLEELLAAELDGLGIRSAGLSTGAVRFESGLEGAYRVCLWSRLANRVLLPLAGFEVDDPDALYAAASEVDWSLHLGPDTTLAVDCSGRHRQLRHTRFAVQRVKDAIVDQFNARSGRRPSVDLLDPQVRVHLHFDRDRVELAIDLSGHSLHRRGYREPGVQAPLKENLAAAMLYRAGWPELARAGAPFVDPMTGSGTLPIEAALIAGDIAPGSLRENFGFLHWRGHDPDRWRALLAEARERRQAGLSALPRIAAYDHDPRAIRTAARSARRAGLEKHLHFEVCRLDSLPVPVDASPGLVAVNPPYGDRIGSRTQLLPLYLSLGQVLKSRFAGWRAIVLNGAGCDLGLAPDKGWQMHNGQIACRLERFELRGPSPGNGPPPAIDLLNRIRKNQRRLKGWLRREQVCCYRIYDADIPEYALAIDLYACEEGDWAHVQEYAPPPSVDERAAAARLRAALNALPEALDLPVEQLVVKQRRRQRKGAQYQRVDRQDRFLTTREGDCRLLVNLTDYLDTGLFLDHRPVRRWIGEQARGKRFLNLFCYTGAATVHAGLGGALATTSVDLSRTYLDWLKRNLELNGLDDPARHRIIRADARAWLKRCSESFDLIFVDPPSFSNSKKMPDVFDVQRDHADLIDSAMARLAPGGCVIFSTNLRRFRLDPALTGRYAVEDRSRWSIPPDFERRPSIHHCWLIRHAAH